MKSVLGFDAPLVPIPATYDGDFLQGAFPWLKKYECFSSIESKAAKSSV